MTAGRLRRTARRQVATLGQFLPKQKSPQVPVSVAAQVEFARAVCRETKASPYPGPFFVIPHQRATRRSSSFARYAESASPLHQGERIEVRGFSLRNETCSRTLTLPSPLRRERGPSTRACRLQPPVHSRAIVRR